MEENNERPETISYYDHEAQIARAENQSRRWSIAALILFLALVLTNAGWIIHESMFVDEYSATQTVTQEGEGTNTFTGDFYGGGYGKANGNDNGNQAKGTESR